LKVDRRTVLIGGGAGIGLIVAYALWPRGLSSDLAVREGEQTCGYYITIARDGRITVAVPQAETGQGVWTALPQIVADELGAAWDSVGVEPAPLTASYGNPLASTEGWLDGFGRVRAYRIASDGRSRMTAGATSVRAFEEPLRDAAAVARAMLIGAAADRWNVDALQCDTADGLVLNGVRTFSFGELAEEAAERSAPQDPPRRQSTKGRLIGQPLARLDGPAKANGSLRFAGDVRLPGMLFASVRLAPPGGQLTRFARRAAAGMPGVRHVAVRAGWVAVVADTWWAADMALKAGDASFAAARTPSNVRPLFEEALANGARKRFRRGIYDDVVEGSRPLAATYFVAPSQHLGLEPFTATARFGGGRLEIWAPTQAPGLVREAAASAARMAAHEVAVYPLPVGSPSGSAIEADAVPIAVELARQASAPVQVVLSQSRSLNHAPVSAGAIARMTALPGEGGITAAWKMQVATANGMGASLARLLEAGEPGRVMRNAVDAIPPYAVPNVTIESVHADLPFRVGYMRGSPQREFAFFTESFNDELARAAGLEPLAFRMSMLGSNGRLARCLQGAARLAQWDGGAPGSLMGLAGCSAYGSNIGLVATAHIGDGERVTVDRLVAAVDCGRVVNRGLIVQQVEAGLLWALAQATIPAPEWVAGMPRAGSLADLPRLVGTPEIVVEVIPSSAPPGGINGLADTVLAPAVANAIAAGSGKRLRDLPFEVA
jgi:isoquinoline 1-oxidoreductase beta subunit